MKTIKNKSQTFFNNEYYKKVKNSKPLDFKRTNFDYPIRTKFSNEIDKNGYRVKLIRTFINYYLDDKGNLQVDKIDNKLSKYNIDAIRDTKDCINYYEENLKKIDLLTRALTLDSSDLNINELMTDIKSSLFEHNELVNNLYKICKSTSIEAATQDAVSNTAAVMKDRLKRVLSSTYKFYFDLSILKDYSEQNANFENELSEQDDLDKYITEIRNKLTQSQIDAARQRLADSTTKSLDIQIKQAETCLKNKINKIYAKTQENDGILSRLERIHCDKNIDDLRILMVCKINNNGTVGDTLVLRGHDSILERSDIKGASIYNVNELDSNENIKEYLNNKRVVYRAVNVSLINSGEKVE